MPSFLPSSWPAGPTIGQRPPWLPPWLTDDAALAEVDQRLAGFADELVPDADRIAFALRMHRRMAWWLQLKDPRIQRFWFQGSMAQGTVIALRRKDEIDLDLYGQYLITAHGQSVRDALEHLKQLLIELREHDRRNAVDDAAFLPSSIDVRRRCVTIAFANGFHMDITKGLKPAKYAFPFIDVPDCGERCHAWRLSGPELFTRAFHEHCMPYDQAKQRVLGLGELTEAELPLHDGSGQRMPLQTAIMLIKWLRNVHAERNIPAEHEWMDHLFPSIAITTLAMRAYSRTSSVTIALLEVARAVIAYCASDEPAPIWNPVMPAKEPEDLATRLKNCRVSWNLAKSWAQSLQSTVTALMKRESLVETFKRVANPEWIAAAEDRRMQGMRQAQARGGLRASPQGTVATAPATGAAMASIFSSAAPSPRIVPHNRFFGGQALADLPAAADPLPAAVQLLALLRDGCLGVEVDGVRSRAWIGRDGTLHWRGRLRPSACSRSYGISLDLTASGWFTARCHDELALAPGASMIPHRYPDGSLCLTHPIHGEWLANQFLSRTVLPWIAWWLACYEGWRETGRWHGAEYPHAPQPAPGQS